MKSGLICTKLIFLEDGRKVETEQNVPQKACCDGHFPVLSNYHIYF